MTPFTCIIADEDEIWRAKLALQLKRIIPELLIIGEAGNGDETIALIQQLDPDIVFMDVDIPFANGFSVLEQCADQHFVLIIITAEEHHALKAIKAGAMDYLLKPARIEELKAALYKAFDALNHRNLLLPKLRAAEKGLYKPVPDLKIPIPVGNFYELVSPGEIMFCRAKNNYTEMSLSDKRKFLLSRTLKFYEERLRMQNFFRIHQSYLVNIDYIKSVEKGKYSFIVLRDGTSLEVAHSRKEQLYGLLGI